MTPAPWWYSEVRVDGRTQLTISAPLVVVIEALSRTLAGLDRQLYPSSRVDVILRLA